LLKSANRTVPKHEPFFAISMLKSLIWWNLLEKREAFLYEEALKTDICAVCFALTALFSFKNEIFSGTDRALFTKTLRFSLRYGSR
jgi:hypothetical protein